MEEQERQFKGIWIPSEIWLTTELSLQEKVVLVEIDSLEDEVKGCFASNKYFANFFKLSPGRISQIITNLSKKQYIEVSYVKEGKEILERQIRIKRPPYPLVNKLNTYLENDKGGIKKTKGGYLENDEENNIKTNNININNKKEIYKEKFEEFYKEYPRKVNKKKTLEWFLKNKPNEELFNIIMNKLQEQKKHWKEKKYIPYPTTWLNGEKWNDELEEENNNNGEIKLKKVGNGAFIIGG